MDVKPYEHQINFWNKNPDKYGLFWHPRLGKTLAALKWTKTPILIICPLFLLGQWEEECRQNGLKALVIGKERFRIDHKILPKYDTVIVDEAHTLAGYGSQVSKALLWYLTKHNIGRVLLLTGTPYTASPWCVFLYGQFLGHWGKDKYIRFRNAFFYEQYFGRRTVWLPKTDAKTKDKLIKLLQSLGETLATDEVFDLPDTMTIPVYFHETKEQAKAKAQNEDIHPLARFSALHQIEASYGQKDEWIEDICQKNPKVIIVCRYTNQIARLAATLKKYNPIVLEGATKDKKEAIERAEQAKHCVLVVNGAIAEGWGVPSFPVMVFASLDWSYTKYFQMSQRNKGPKQPKKTVDYVLLTKGGVDEDVWGCLKDKKDFNVSLYNK